MLILVIGDRWSATHASSQNGWHSELVGSWFCRRLVSERSAGFAAAALVRAATEFGRVKFQLLWDSKRGSSGELVPADKTSLPLNTLNTRNRDSSRLSEPS